MAEREKPCVFCAIIDGKIPAKKVFEDSDSIAFLDINPRSPGMTIVAPKKHSPRIQDNFMGSLKTFQAAENVLQMIVERLGAKTVEIAAMHSEEVPHFHFRLYPIYGDEKPLIEGQPMKMSDDELNTIANKISSVSVDIFATRKEEMKEPEKEWSEEDVAYIRKQIEKD
jgi:histidine triad (HIT) family protein